MRSRVGRERAPLRRAGAPFVAVACSLSSWHRSFCAAARRPPDRCGRAAAVRRFWPTAADVQRLLKFNERSTKFQRSLKLHAPTTAHVQGDDMIEAHHPLGAGVRGCRRRPLRRSRRARPGRARRAARRRRRPRGGHGHRAPPRGDAAGRADRGLGVLRRAARDAPAPRDITWLQQSDAERHAAGRARLELDADRLHPRRRPAGPAVGLRARRRPLRRRRVHRAARRAPCSTSTTSSASRCCAARRARSTAATPSAARSSTSPGRSTSERARRARQPRLATARSTSSSSRLDAAHATRSRSARSRALYRRDGYGKNQLPARSTTTRTWTRFRAQAEWQPTDDLFVRLAGDYVDDDSTPQAWPPRGAGAGSTAGDAASSRTSTTRCAGIGDDNSVENEGVVAHASAGYAERRADVQVDHRLPRGRDRLADRLRHRAPAAGARRAGLLHERPDHPGIPAAVRRERLQGVAGALLPRCDRLRRVRHDRRGAQPTIATSGDVETDS